MEKNKFITGTFILLLGGLITKIFGFVIKIIYTRLIGPEGISLYSLIIPTYSLIVTVAGFGMPLAISKMISENNHRSKDIMSSSIYLLLGINIIFMLLIIIFSDFIATSLLNAPDVKVLLIGSTLAMPNMAIACIFKGYFYGKQKMLPNTISNIIEQTIRLLFIIFIMPYFLKKSLIIGILSFILVNIITEGASILTFMILLPKNTSISLKDIKYHPDISHKLLHISVPLMSGKIIGSIGFFFEPIILSNTLKMVGYNPSFFIEEYGIYNGYSMSLLLLPTFFITALSTSLVPEISKYYAHHKYHMVKKRCHQALKISLVFGIITTIFIFFNKDILLKLIYNTNLGTSYLSFLCLFFPLYYLEAPLSSILQALNKSKYVMKITTISVFIKLIVMFISTLFHIGIYSLIISELVNILYIVITYYQKVNYTLKKELT